MSPVAVVASLGAARPGEVRARLLGGLASGVQAAVATAAAWAAAGALGHERPLFAPIAALVALGATASGRFARSIELTLGVAFGILAGDLVRATVGYGGWSIGLAVFLAIGFARIVEERPLMLTQAGISAVLAVALDPQGDGLILTRLADAGVGVAVAVLVSAVVFPPRPDRLVDEALTRLLGEVGAVLGESAVALEEVDTPRAERALDRARRLDVEAEALEEALDVARETLLTRPLGARDRHRVAEVREATPHLDLAIRNLRVLARAAARHTRAGARPADDLLGAVRELQAGVGVLLRDGQALECHVVAALALGSRASVGHDELAVHAVVAQLRSLAVDLLRAGGLDQDAALQRVTAATSRA